MSNQLQKKQESQGTLALTTLKQPLLDVLEQKGNNEVNNQLSLYRERGIVDHTKTLAIPMSERIPALV